MSTVHPKKRISLLLIEDSDDDAFFFGRALDRAGLPYVLDHVYDGQAAIRYFERKLSSSHEDASELPSLVFLDLKLPLLNGYDVLEWMRDRGLLSQLTILVLSGSDASIDVNRVRSYGIDEYFVKPLSPGLLREKVLAAADQKKSRG